MQKKESIQVKVTEKSQKSGKPPVRAGSEISGPQRSIPLISKNSSKFKAQSRAATSLATNTNMADPEPKLSKESHKSNKIETV